MSLILTNKQPWRRQPQGLVLPTEFAQNAFKWLFIGTPSGLKKVWGKGGTNLTYTGTAFASGVESTYSAIGYGPTDTVDSGTVTSYATLPVASRPTSGFVLVHGKRNGTISTSGICQILNCRSSSETNYVSISMGNRFAATGSKNKIILETTGGSFGNLFVDGLDQGGNSSLREYLSGESAVFGGNITSYAGTAFDIHAKATGTYDYCFPHTIFLLGIADRIFSDAEIVEATRNPYGLLFKPRRKVTYFSVTSGGTQTLTPSLLTNSQTFHAPTITTGAVSLAPSLVTNTQTFHSATVSQGGVTLQPSLVTNTQTFFGSTVSVGNVTLSPSLLTNGQTFYAPTVNQGDVLHPSLYTNEQTFYAPAITTGVVDLTPSLVTNTQTFFAPTVANVGESQSLTPDLFTNGQTFYSATVSTLTLTQADLDAIAAAVWADATAVAAHAKLDAIIARLTC